MDYKTAIKKYIKAAIKGVVKTMAKMGISTIQSYRGAQIFEAVGLNSEFVEKYFTWTPTRIQGVGLDVVAEEALAHHRRRFTFVRQHGTRRGRPVSVARRRRTALVNPQTIHKLQTACRPAAKKFTANTPISSTTGKIALHLARIARLQVHRETAAD